MYLDQDLPDSTKALIESVRRDKYMQKNEANWQDTLMRVAKGIFPNEPKLQESFMIELTSGRIVPAGRILAGAGTDKAVTWINCFVLNNIEDSLNGPFGIMDSLARAAKTMQMGGGIGQDFSTLRPSGARVHGVDAPASGVLHFMDLWHAMCGTIMSAGSRRGAMMATLRDDHPDLWHPSDPCFLSAKRTPGRLTNFNISVLVSDAFMEAVNNDAEWKLGFCVPRYGDNKQECELRNGKPWYIYTRVSARLLWNEIMKGAYTYAEPGIIFIDRVNRENPLSYCETISSTNPCGEQPLPPNGDCNLSAMNLARFVYEPFTKKAAIDFNALKHSVKILVHALDNVISLSPFPLVEQAIEARTKRRIGIGITGLGTMLMMLGEEYGSNESLDTIDVVMNFIKQEAYSASADLAKIYGAFLAFSSAYLEGNFFKTLNKDVQEKIRDNGLRNGVLLTIAPTGTTSIAQGDNCSSGIEPAFALTYRRKVLQQDGSFVEHEIQDLGYTKYLASGGDAKNLPSYMKTAEQLSVSAHLAVQAVCQQYIDSSISKTINCPTEMSFADFKNIYKEAYAQDLKGCTTYRFDPESGRGAVLTKTEEKPLEGLEAPPLLGKRPQLLTGVTYKLRWPHQDEAIYMTINTTTDGSPFEIFLTSKNVKHAEWMAALTRLISAVFRKGGNVEFLVEELSQVMSADGGAFITPPGDTKPRHVPSIVALIGYTLAHFFQKKVPTQGRAECPSCGSQNYNNVSGCWTCADCGSSKCS